MKTADRFSSFAGRVLRHDAESQRDAERLLRSFATVEDEGFHNDLHGLRNLVIGSASARVLADKIILMLLPIEKCWFSFEWDEDPSFVFVSGAIRLTGRLRGERGLIGEHDAKNSCDHIYAALKRYGGTMIDIVPAMKKEDDGSVTAKYAVECNFKFDPDTMTRWILGIKKFQKIVGEEHLRRLRETED